MNQRFAINFSIYIALILISAVEGWRSTYLVDFVLTETPDSVEAFILFWLRHTGGEYLANPVDMEVLALLLYWLIATLLFAWGLAGLKRWASRYFIAKKNGEAIPRLPFLVMLVMSLLAFVVSCDLGWYLSLLFGRYTVDIPLPVKALIKAFQSVTGQGGGADADDYLAYFAVNLYWAIATLCVGVLLISCCLAMRRFIRRKTS
ncbi:hypothetical protein B0G81_1913 [Paraburkholderia sp. BL6665CI2N2]|uniref:hypothetical protein n=1 Tax=Paraburkholderia sp. BL6665CI2N2 TaxID=1938806 RepID=UPI001064BBAB|nr:hypothetical protein [Paraburkholderia sp. BL6665CI2N2]TDY21684.1 hypothetical protein B0G81_1913 [Paraburkholderia sp. BL6665CI2N2]